MGGVVNEGYIEKGEKKRFDSRSTNLEIHIVHAAALHFARQWPTGSCSLLAVERREELIVRGQRIYNTQEQRLITSFYCTG